MVDVKSVIREVIGHYLDLNRSFIFLFGSRASGDYKAASDYDIGIYTGEKIPLSVIAKIKDELEDYPISVDIDVVDFSQISSEFKQIALKEVTVWNTPKTNLKLI